MMSNQQYPPGAQNIFKEFPTNNFVTENCKELYYPKGGRAGGSETALRSQPGSHFVALRGSEGVGGSPYFRPTITYNDNYTYIPDVLCYKAPPYC